jgi:hypothetical protein
LHRALSFLRCDYQPQVPTAPQAVQKSQPSLRITVWLPHSAHSEPCITLARCSSAREFEDAHFAGRVAGFVEHAEHGVAMDDQAAM